MKGTTMDVFNLILTFFLLAALLLLVYIPYMLIMKVIRGTVKTTKKTYASFK